MTNKFCAEPWREVFITATGNYGLCCMEDQNYNLSRTSVTQEINQHWNSDYMKATRQGFLRGESLPQCNHCWKDEANGKVSGRIRRNQQYFGKGDLTTDDPVVADVIAETGNDGEYNGQPTGLFFSVGDSCQLRCITCAPAYSRSILKDYEKLGWDVNSKSRQISLETDTVHNKKLHNDSLWQRVRELAPTVRWMKITGGEPTLSRPLLEFLKWFNQQGYAKDTTLAIITNAVNVKPEFIEVLKSFRQVRLEISVDGVGAVDEYLRYPTNWAKKEILIDQLTELFPGSLIHSVAYALNLGDLPNLIRWAETKPVLHSIQCLTWPEQLDIQHLPEEYKQKMIKELSPWAEQATEFVMGDKYDPINYRNNSVLAVVNRLKNPGNSEHWDYIKNLVHSYDQIRPTNLADLIPNLKSSMNHD